MPTYSIIQLMIEYDGIRPNARLVERVGAVLGTFRRNGRVQAVAGIMLAEAGTAALLTASYASQGLDTEDGVLRAAMGAVIGIGAVLVTATIPNFLESLGNQSTRILAQERNEKNFKVGDTRGFWDYLSHAWQLGEVQRYGTYEQQTPLTAEQMATRKRMAEALRPRTPAELERQRIQEFCDAERRFATWQRNADPNAPNPFIWERTIQLPPKDK